MPNVSAEPSRDFGVPGIEPVPKKGGADMTERAHHAATGSAFRPWQHWQEWVGCATVWSLIYGAPGLWWALGGQLHGVSAELEEVASLSPRCPVFRVEKLRPGTNNYPQADYTRKGNA